MGGDVYLSFREERPVPFMLSRMMNTVVTAKPMTDQRIMPVKMSLSSAVTGMGVLPAEVSHLLSSTVGILAGSLGIDVVSSTEVSSCVEFCAGVESCGEDVSVWGTIPANKPNGSVTLEDVGCELSGVITELSLGVLSSAEDSDGSVELSVLEDSDVSEIDDSVSEGVDSAEDSGGCEGSEISETELSGTELSMAELSERLVSGFELSKTSEFSTA